LGLYYQRTINDLLISTLTALSLCIITHPTLQSRIILTAISLSLFGLLVLIAGLIPRITYTFLHPILRICTASTGAFGVIVAVSLLTKPQEQGWANAWERLWMSDGDWGSGKEQGLSAAWAIFFVSGMATDWALKRWIGECPDEVSCSLLLLPSLFADGYYRNGTAISPPTLPISRARLIAQVPSAHRCRFGIVCSLHLTISGRFSSRTKRNRNRFRRQSRC